MSKRQSDLEALQEIAVASSSVLDPDVLSRSRRTWSWWTCRCRLRTGCRLPGNSRRTPRPRGVHRQAHW